METFKHLYVCACEQNHILVDKRVLSSMNGGEGNTNSFLDLSGHVMCKKTCIALGQALAKDVHLTQLDFNDCMLPEEGLMEILKGLENNTSLLCLSLKGNNIKGDGVEALGRLLRHNSYLQHLTVFIHASKLVPAVKYKKEKLSQNRLNLEWNALGMLPEKFSLFCEALSVNNTIKRLDLKNNQLNHQCATAIADVLQRNSTLESLALQWNNFGLLGGRALLKSLLKNKTLMQLYVNGNNIPVEIENGIEIAVMNNREKQQMVHKHAEQARGLAVKLAETENEKNIQMKALLDTVDKKEQELSSAQRLNSMKIQQLEQQLAEKDAFIESLTSKHEEVESCLITAEKKLKDLSALFSRMEMENEKLRIQHQAVLSSERKERSEAEAELHREIRTLKERIITLQLEVEDFKQNLTYQENNSERLKLVIQKLEAQAKSREAAYIGEVDDLKEKHAEALRESTQLRQKEVARLKSEYSEMEDCFQQRIKNLEMQKLQLEEEMGEMKNQIAHGKLQKEQVLQEQKQKMKEQESDLKKRFEEKIDILQAATEKKEQLLKEQLKITNELQTKNSSLQYEVEEQQHQVQQLQQALEASKEDAKIQVVKVQLEVKEKLEELSRNKETVQNLTTEIQLLKKQLEEVQASHSKEIASKDETIEDLKKEIAAQHKKMQQLVESEAKRAAQLQNAVLSYVTDVKQASVEIS